MDEIRRRVARRRRRLRSDRWTGRASLRRLRAAVLATLVLAACAGEPGERLFTREPVGVMGTRSVLMVLLPPELHGSSETVLQEAEDELRRMESLFSTWIDSSELSRLNAARGGERVPLSPEVLEVLDAARRLHRDTGGAFDITARPLMDLWRVAIRQGRQPAAAEIAAAREASRWTLLELHPDGATKAASTVTVDVDGIAKGYAIDRALEVLRAAGARGGLVEVGGDLRVFGEGPEGHPWLVGIRDPWRDRSLGRLGLANRAACTSGGYARYAESGGRRFSEILDPESGRLLEIESGGGAIASTAVISATVLAPDALTADAWATALTVLGPAGLELLPADAGIDALLIMGDEEGHRFAASDDFPTDRLGEV